MKRTAYFLFPLLASVVTLTSCGGGGATSSSGAITVAVSATTNTVVAGGTVPVTARVSNDSSNRGVTWTISPASGAGTLSNVSSTSVTYNAVANPPHTDLKVTITATSVSDTSKSSSATITVPAVTVSVTPATANAQAGGTVPIGATVNNDPSDAGVTWTISPASGAGSLSDVSNSSVTYNAPVSPPASHVTATITATAVADTSKSGSSTVTIASVVVSIAPTSATVPANGTKAFTAAVQNDPASKGVRWSISPASGAGTLSNATSTSVTYNAPGPPASLPASGLDATITAASVADPLGSSSANITVPSIAVIVDPAGAGVIAGGSQTFKATVQNDIANKGVTWSISPASGAGTISNATSSSVTYTAPANPPASDLNVALTATPISDPRQSVQVSITVPAIRVAVSPVSGLIPVDAGQQFTATVQNDPKGNNITWKLSQAGSACSPSCGTLSALNSGSATPITYTAPPTLPSNPAVTLTATSATDTSKSASAAIKILIGTVKIVPASLDFGLVKVSKSKSLAVTLTNTGNTMLRIASITINPTAGVFSLSDPRCGTSVGAGMSCPVTVSFKPTSSGTFHGTLSISDSSEGSPQQVLLSGQGLAGRAFSTQAVRSAVARNRIVVAPAVTGPMHVGTRILQLVDATRLDPYSGNGSRRELLVRFWYPTLLNQGCKLAEYTSPRVWNYFSELLGIPLPQVRTNSCWNAPSADGAHSIVVFTPGYTGTFTDYTFLFEDLASRGYVVAAIDHTYEATAVEFPDGRFVKSVFGSYLGKAVRSDEQAFASAVSVRLSDLNFVLDEMEHMNTSAQSPFFGKLDTSSVALAGHSLGGLAAILGIAAEPRFRAGIVIDSVMPDEGSIGAIDKAILILAAGSQQWGAEESRLWDNLRGPRLAVRLWGAEHVTPSDAVWLAKGAIKTGTMNQEKTVAAIRNYIAAFLDVNLKGKRVNPLLIGPSAVYPDAIVTTQRQSLRSLQP